MSDLININVINKSAAEYVAAGLIRQLEIGYADGAQLFAVAKYLEEIAGQIKANEAVKQSARNQTLKSPANYKGATISMRQSVKYDYSKSEAWQAVKQELDKVSEILKEVEEIAKKASGPVQWTNPLTGEELQIMPAIKLSTDSIVVSLAK